MNVLSLFDGISCARVAVGNNVKTYYASEIDPNAIKVAQKNHPTTVQLGDVKSIKEGTIKEPIDLLIGGSPCTDLSIGKKGRKGLEGDHSKLFWEYIRIKNIVKPKWFILENVASMLKKDKEIITQTLGVEPILIDAALVSAQSRKRYFWTNIPNVTVPEDKKVTLSSILQPDNEVGDEFFIYGSTSRGKKQMKAMSIRGHKDASGNYIQTLDVRDDDKGNALTSTYSQKLALVGRIVNRRLKDGKRHDGDKSVPQTAVVEERTDGKSGTLTSVAKDNVVINKFVFDKEKIQSIRRLTPIECERLQSLPDNYTEGISRTARHKALGNAFNVNVIRHILSFLP